MKYVIIGGGPTGLSLAWILAKNNIKVDLIEKETELGGSWKSDWINDKYFSENSPRVLSSSGYCRDFLLDVGLQPQDFSKIYGTMFETNVKLFKFIQKYFTIFDYFEFLRWNVIYRFYKDSTVVQEFLDKSRLSQTAKYAIRMICITICDLPKNTNLHDFFGSLGPISLEQMKQPDKWHELLLSKFEKMPQIKVLTNTSALSFKVESNSHIKYVNCNSNGNKFKLYGDRFVLATQSDSIFGLLSFSYSNYLVNNWFNRMEMKKWCDETYYSGFGFQIHFKEKIKFPKEWCWSCTSDWSIIILPVSNWLNQVSRDQNINTVWSCCIIDMDSKSKATNKTVNQSTKDEILREAVRQLRQNYHFPNPDAVTMSEGLYKQNGKWKSAMTGFTRKSFPYLPMKGRNIDNIYAIGCFTKPFKPSIAYMETAVQSSVRFVEENHSKLCVFKRSYNKLYVFILCFAIILSIYSIKKLLVVF